MATLEREMTKDTTREFVVRLTAEQAEKLQQAADAEGQSVADFAALSLSRAADTTLNPPPYSHPLDKVIGIFKDEPLMEALMERIREDRRRREMELL